MYLRYKLKQWMLDLIIHSKLFKKLVLYNRLDELNNVVWDIFLSIFCLQVVSSGLFLDGVEKKVIYSKFTLF